MKKTKIIATIGPASCNRVTIKKMVHAGMNGVRINTAYGDTDQYQSVIETVRKVVEIPIIIDLKGPEIRLKTIQKRELRKGEVVEVGFNCEDEISFNHNFYDTVTVGDVLLIDNGKIRTIITEKADENLRLLVIISGTISDGKGVNLPNKHFTFSTLTDYDLDIIDFAKKFDVEYIALSFTRNVCDVEDLANIYDGGIIAKIENFEGVQNVNAILEVANGIMVARGDLGVEIEPEKVPLVQKSIIKRCNQRGKLVVTATEMLESMVHNPQPTRAEVSDVANAILDGSDTVMLSGETAIGQYPVEAVEMMSRIANETETATKSNVADTCFVNLSDTVSRAIQRICQSMPLDKVITLTKTGYTARMISRFKVSQPIIAVTPDIKVKKQLELTFGVQPVLLDYLPEKDPISFVANKLYSAHLLSDKETVLFTAGAHTTMRHASNSIEIHKIAELRKFLKQ
ncbi:MAG: pyruvate kinase [Candidatus Bathyarchaeota archaeon]|nr:pyruvate kinase [Candidatus Termiticorpusculum sp.]MCL1971199.1 pyruvate kinase [Candidatus Termiticorpusculum sp.]